MSGEFTVNSDERCREQCALTYSVHLRELLKKKNNFLYKRCYDHNRLDHFPTQRIESD